MCHDGARSTLATSGNSVIDSDGTGTVHHGRENQERVVFRAMISWLALRGFDVALINEVEWRDSKVRIALLD